MKKIYLCFVVLFISVCGCGDKTKSTVIISEYINSDNSEIQNVSDGENDNPMDNAIVKQGENTSIQDIDIQINSNSFPVSIPVGYDISIDLDGDEEKEYVLFSLEESANSGWVPISFVVGEKEYVDLLSFPVVMTNPDLESYYITDLNTSDNFYEIALLDQGPSNDLVSYFFRYENKNLIYIGNIQGYVGDQSFVFDGKGGVTSLGRLTVLQTWWAPFHWKLNQEDFIEQVVQTVYYPVQYDDTYENDYPITLLEKINLYENPDLNSRKIVAEPSESKITFTITDNKDWVYLQREDGVEGWLNMGEYEALRNPKSSLSPIEIFANLSYSD